MRNLLIISFSVILQNAFPQITFKARADYLTGNSPTSVAASDFNGDNKIDLAVTDRNTNIVSIYNGTGLGSFGPKVNFTTGVNPSNSVVGDFNADSKPDLAITNNGANSVSILLNTGSGFGPKTDFATENLPQSIQTADMNNDGKFDLVISYSNVALVSILIGDGSGGFGARTNFPTGTNPRSVAVGDLNGDNKIDVVTANTNASGTISILLGNGDGTIAPKMDYAASISPVSVALGDLNNDGKPDLAVANNGDQKVSILLGNGDGTVGPKTDIPIGTTLTRILIEDIDKNNVEDIVLTGTFMTVLFGTGSGSFGPKNEFITNGPLVNGVISDFDGDCQPDVAAPGVNTFSVHINNGSGGFLANVEYATGSEISDVTVGDFNEDSKSDFVTLNAGSNSISLLLGGGDGTFGPKSDFPTAALPSGMAKGDFNGDGHLDIVTTNFIPNSMSLLLGNGSGDFGIKTDFPVGAGPIHIAVGDLNDDGKLDVVTTNRLARSISILMGTGSGSFDPKVDYTVGSVTTPWEVAVGDLNGDNKQDIVVAHWDFGNQLVGVFLNSGTGTFPFSTDYTTGSNPNSVVIGDFNNDGKPDLATANQNVSSRSVSILLGTGTGTFGVKTDFGMGLTSLPGKIVAGDLNNDGNLDLVTTRGTQLNVAVLLGDGTGNFNNIVQFGTGPNVSLEAIDLGDFNGDGLKDIVTENNTSSVAVILSYVAAPPSPPVISSFLPLSGGEGTTVVISGGNFDLIPAGNIVAFNGVNALVTASSVTSITATVPTGATTGPIQVTIGCSTVNSGTYFTVGVIGLPTITSFTPTSGPIGTTVTITGTNFDPVPTNNTVSFNGTAASIPTSVTATTLTVVVPTTAATGPISVSTPDGIATSSTNFTVTVPILISPQPSSLSVCEGETAHFTVGASGTSGITYQWQKISSEAASLSGLRWNIPSLGSVDADVDNASDPITVTTTMGGVTGTNYSVTLRFRGVVETKTYFGGITNGFWNAGGTPDAGGYNVYELNVSDPPGVYYLNVGSSDLLYCHGIDYQQTITIKAGATIQLKAQTRDNKILKNKDQFGNPFVIPGIDPSPDPFNGQFIQMDIVAVDGIGYTDVSDGGGYTGATSTSLSINTSGNFGKGIYRCKVSGDLAEDTYSTAATLIIHVVPLAPLVTSNSGCSGTSVSLSASGATPGQYRWYPVATGGTAIASETNGTYLTPTLTSTTPYYASINDGTCESSRTEVLATINSLPAPPGVQPVNPICPSSDIILTATGGTDGQYRWYDGATLIAGQVNSTYTASSLTATKTFQVAIHDGTCESNKASVTATVQSCTAPIVASTTATAFIEGTVLIDLQELVTDEENNIDPTRLQITMQPVSGAPATLSGFELSINYTGFPLVGEDQVGIEVCDLTNLCSNQQLTIELGGDITVYNGFSPNGDGLNEFFKIQYIEILPETQNNQVFIYNRWGDEVFSIRDYNNVDRVFKGDSKNGKKLPTGTYFYKVVFSNGKKSMTGFLELKY